MPASATIISANGASQMRAACWATASNTGCTSPGEFDDHAQDVADRGLLLARLGELAREEIELLSGVSRRIHQNAQRPTAKNAAASTR